ncbi:hypothetical protein [Corallococcus exercitus]|uniref:hypothetical protein n=1 Tax=Corallococcus exercitus TaxID=2316736 RepID=UPI0035D47BC4
MTRQPELPSPTSTIRFASPIGHASRLRNGALFVDTSAGAHIVRGDAVQDLPPTPLRWPELPYRCSASVWELTGGQLHCHRDWKSTNLAYVLGADDEVTLAGAALPSEISASAKLNRALPGLPGEAIFPSGNKLVRLDALTGAYHVIQVDERPDSLRPEGARLGEWYVAWTHRLVKVFDLTLRERASLSFPSPNVSGVAVLGEWVVVRLQNEVLILDSALEEYGRVACRAAPRFYELSGTYAADADHGWLHLAGNGRLSTLNVAAGKVRWEKEVSSDVEGIVALGDLLCVYPQTSAHAFARAAKTGYDLVLGSVVTARFGGHAGQLRAWGVVRHAIGLGGTRLACVWHTATPADGHRRTVAVWMNPSEEGDPVIVDEYSGLTGEICEDGDGALVSWGDGTLLKRWTLSALERCEPTRRD